MVRLVIGIDPGIGSAVAVLTADGDLIAIHEMSTQNGERAKHLEASLRFISRQGHKDVALSHAIHSWSDHPCLFAAKPIAIAPKLR